MWFPTNKPVACEPTQQNKQHHNCLKQQHVVTPKISHTTPTGCVTGTRVTAVIAWGKRPVPFRTRKLRPTAPMVLHPGGCGRVGHRRTTITARPRHHVSGPSLINTHHPTRQTRFRQAQPAPTQTRPANPDPPSEPAGFTRDPPS